MSIRRPVKNVFVDGVLTDAHEVRTNHDVDDPIGTGSVTLDAPRPSQVDLAAPVRVEAGYEGEAMYPIFDGRLVEDEAGFDEGGGELRAEMEGWGKLLWYPNSVDQSILGPVRLDAVFISGCRQRGVPYYFADAATNPDGTNLVFGGIAQVDTGLLVIERDSSPGDMIGRLGSHYGYKIFDTPGGVLRFQKVSGAPAGFYESAVRNYVEGVNMFSVKRRRTLKGMANYHEVLGAKYTAADTSEMAVRSFPATITADSRLGPYGVARARLSDPDILTNARADQARNVQEVDRTGPFIRYAWTAEFDPAIQPGQVVTVQSPTVNGTDATDPISLLASLAPVTMWLMSVSHTLGDGVWVTAMEGWLGTGTALPAGNDCVTTTILGSTGRHVGNEYLAHYRRKNPDGLTATIPFTVLDDYSTLTIRCIGHGSNSFVRNTESEASKFEIWQTVGGVYKRVASGDMPRIPEYLESRLDYKPQSLPIYLEDGSSTMNPDYFWQNMVIPLSGSLIAGAADLKIISGKDSDVGDNDDYEVANVQLVTCGVGTPVIIS